MLMYFCLFLLQFQTNKSIATVGGSPWQPEVRATIVMDAAFFAPIMPITGFHRLSPQGSR